MKVQFAKSKTKDTYYTLVPLNWLLRLFNLSCIYRKGIQMKVSWSLTKIVIHVFAIGFINFFFLFSKIKRMDETKAKEYFTFSDSIQLTYLFGYCEYMLDLFYVYKYGRECRLKYFELFDRIDQILGMTYYEEIRKILLRTFGFSVIIFFMSSAFDYASWVQGFGFISPTLYSLDYVSFFLNMLTVLDHISHTIQVEYRLIMMKDLLQSYYNSPDCTESTPDEKTWASRKNTKSKSLESLKTLCYGRFIEVVGFNRCYLLLLEQTCYINAMFGVRGVVYCINLLINMISLLNVAIRTATGSMGTHESLRLSSISSMMRLLNWAILACIVVYRCEKSYRQSENILTTIDLVLVKKNSSPDLTTTLVDLRNLLLTRPIKFHAFHFFTIDYTLLVSIASAVVTYTIIMLQSMQ